MMGHEAQVKTLLASQPIYNAKKNLFGCELLFRHELFASADAYGEDLATSEVLLNLCTGITQQIDLFARKIFINLSEGLLLSDAFLPLPPESVVIELPASICISEALINGIKKWKNAGFSFALDGFDFNPRYQPILNDIQYLKVDALNESIDDVASKISQMRNDSVIWIAERVETEAQFVQFKKLGFSLFQGYFLAKPLAVQGQTVRGKIHTSLTTINTVSQPDIEIDDMARVVSRDPSLATQLLKIVNSPVCALLRPMSSIRDAIVYLGLIQVRKWIIMMSLLNETTSSTGAIHLVLTRAKACENYVAATLHVKSDQAFLVGLLSGVHLLFGIDNALFLQQVSLQPEIAKAILEEEGLLGGILSKIKQVEYAIQQHSARGINQDAPEFAAYHRASGWAEGVLTTTSTS
ncbi:MAG: HDOD domain-containing protein [Desulfuromusa sp.]|jgi:EAL and modified HD-GYP domain-containing signal transduction protein|nr:HDOD domain-containing protein [Desulfuromusa sp.]